jgi:flagellar hook capping protein FlgD
LPRLAITVLLLALLAGTTTAFALTEALKLERSPVTRPHFKSVFSPTCGCPRETARLAVKLRRAELIDAVMVDEDDNAVRTLVSAQRLGPGRVVFRWDGRDDGGAIVPDGTYRLRLHFAKADWTILIPNTVRVDTRPPAIALVSLEPRRVELDGEGATIVVRVSERGHPILLANGEIVLRGVVRDPGRATLVWDGSAEGRPLSPGRYALTVEAQDRAGNVSAPTQDVIVRIVRPRQ